jgi:16S rRNA (cytidine1402-2'-O)-methyltransferase
MSKLYIVPTPIGNLEDITLRALKILDDVDLILAEDTRKTGILLRKHNISKRTLSHHKFNEHRYVEQLSERILNGEVMALVSEAGTPGISDPGYLLIRECIRKQVEVECLPGPTAFIPALVASGLPCDRFVFEGFLPQKKGRQKRLNQLKEETRTIILYESPHRIHKCLHQLIEIFGEDRPACLARELTKIHEEFTRGTIGEILLRLEDADPKGECIILVGAP